MHSLQWIKCEGGSVFCSLVKVDLTEQDGDGVYIIWNSETRRAVYVGQGNIKERLSHHRFSPDVLVYGYDALLATWAFVSDIQNRVAIERYLHRMLTPVASSCDVGVEIPVNLPE